MKVCKKCGRELDESCFYRNKRMKDGLQTYCKKCFDEMLKQSKAKHKNAHLIGNNENNNITTYRVYSNPKLAAFTPRELIKELKARGYTGELKYTYTIKL